MYPDPVVCWENACGIARVIRASVMPVRHLIAKCQGLIVMAVVTMATRAIVPVASMTMSMTLMMLELSVLSVMTTRAIASVASMSMPVMAMMVMVTMGSPIPGKVEC